MWKPISNSWRDWLGGPEKCTALLTEVSIHRSRTYDVDWCDEPAHGRPAPMSIRVDGETVELNLTGSQHVGACIAALCAMADAEVRGVTHFGLRTRSKLFRIHSDGLIVRSP